jgi:hypothetical protein
MKVGLFGLLVLDPLYPLMKRWTYWPQAWLGEHVNRSRITVNNAYENSQALQ